MASADDNIVELFKKYCSLGGNKDAFTSKACGKLVTTCWVPKYKKEDVKTMVDSSVFSKMTAKNPKKTFAPTSDNINEFVKLTAHEIVKKKKNPKVPIDDPDVKTVSESLIGLIKDPDIKEVKQSKTGNVDSLTDSSKYTGSHANRFGEDGKGLGVAGRKDIVKNDGYVNNAACKK